MPGYMAGQAKNAGRVICRVITCTATSRTIRISAAPRRARFFTEEQFHAAANTAYAWSNLVQLQCMAGSIRLTVGVPLSDRNMRRLLDAASGTPLRPRRFAIMKRPMPATVLKADQRRINKLAREYPGRFTERARMKTEHREFSQVKSIVEAVEQADQMWQERVLGELGVEVLWIDDFTQLPQLTRAISG